MEPAALGVLLEPRPQPRPLAQQRLVCDLDRPLVRGQQPAVRQCGERGRSVLVAAGLELVERHAAAHEGALVVLARVGQPQEDASRGYALVAGESVVSRLGEPANRAAYTAGPLVGGPAHHVAVALAPLLEQRGREQRQPAGLVEHVGYQRVGKRGLDTQTHAARGLDDRPVQLVAVAWGRRAPGSRRRAARGRRGSRSARRSRRARRSRPVCDGHDPPPARQARPETPLAPARRGRR